MRFLLGICLLLGFAVAAVDEVGFGGKPFLGPTDSLRRLFAPYDLVKLHVLGATYCENLLDCRLNVTSYSHLTSELPGGDGYNLQFPDDSARFLECVAWEDQFSPIVRLELARRLVKGLLAARIQGSFCESYFRHRSGGKTFLICGEKPGTPGRLTLSMWGDELVGSVKVGFRARSGREWLGMDAFRFEDAPDGLLEASTARADRWWHRTPITVSRRFVSKQDIVAFTGRYWLSDENKPLEYTFARVEGAGIQAVIGEPGSPMPLLGDYRLPTTIHLPDRKTLFRSDRDGDWVFERPDFRYLILRKSGGAFGTAGYSAALLVMWDGSPERVEVIADKGYGEVRVRHAGRKVRVWLNPYYWLDDADIELVHRNAEHFLRHGTLLQKGFPTQQMWNAIPAGLAAGAYLLARYRDPMADTAWINARRVVDRLFAAEEEGKTLVRAFFPVRAAAWLVKAARERGDQAMAQRYEALLDRAVSRMCSPAIGYDGSAWASGWDHFNSMKALLLAHDATGRPEYRDAFDRALGVYTIDEHGIYRNGTRMEAPGGFDTYSGTLPLAVWGAEGKLDWVEQLINLAVPNGWHEPGRLVRDTWNDAGAGPWAQDDANPEFLGLVLKGLKLPAQPKTIVPVGAFPSFDSRGDVTASNAPLLRNPFFLPGVADTGSLAPEVARLSLLKAPATYSGRRTLSQRLPLGDAKGAALDMRITGTGFRVEISPDGSRWYERLDTYDPVPADHSLDLGWLCGSREELVKLRTVRPEERRHAPRGGSFTYKLVLPNVTICRIELLVGNGYIVEVSADGKSWRRTATSEDPDGGGGKLAADAATIRMIDVTEEAARAGGVYLRLRDVGNAEAYDGQTAFLQRAVVYGALHCRQAWVRVSNVSPSQRAAFTIERMELRTWR